MQGKTVVITGATSGIGEVAAETLAARGARIVFTARDEARAQATLRRLAAVNPAVAHDFVLADLSVLAAMKTAGAALAAKAGRIDVLINNAGAIFDHREVTADRLEKTFALNHMAYFVVTWTLRPNLAQRARIISTASGAHRYGRLDFGDLQSQRRFSALEAYGRSKLCNIAWTYALSRRLAETGITANCFHPGGVNTRFGADTRGLQSLLLRFAQRFMLTPAQGADTLIWLASAREVGGRTGGYWVRRRLSQPSAAARDPEVVAHLWAESARIAGWPELAA
ncbi:MAG TPA: SDR family NAD(P)-dependent oxidoreductase [Caulobacteraceae bacterium]|jgi:NAD(P)-dependent dehydrogenase (short-subunit alcohol dehydrogenase family)|nr:SDR family NAD(P)-dependent oxidoreductase [Caulobacteraceae bacterium]